MNKPAKAKYNLHSPSRITLACDLRDIDGWFERELAEVTSIPLKAILGTVAQNLDEFISWPQHALLLWYGCDRIKPEGEKQKYHDYPSAIERMASERKVKLDRRTNGPAIAAFLLAGGNRPVRYGSKNSWSIHHLYSGKFPYDGREITLHAAKEGQHFTQSAGLVATHPVADALSDEFPFFAWRLRAEAFRRFGYDPDKVFGMHHNELGFAEGKECQVVLSEPRTCEPGSPAL